MVLYKNACRFFAIEGKKFNSLDKIFSKIREYFLIMILLCQRIAAYKKRVMKFLRVEKWGNCG